MNQNLESPKFSEAGSDSGFLGAIPSSGNNPVISASGGFVQPSGSFAQPSGAFSQPLFEQVAQEYREISGDYKVGDAIGRGGCAVVLEAWRLSDNMHVVIKVIQLSAGFDEKEAHVAIARFMREAKLIASLHEKHVVQCVDYGCFQGTPCMVLEYVDGLSLDKLIQKYGAIPLEFATGIVRQLLSALVETHSQKIIHRDIKPSNIMVFDSAPPYEIRVLDFGISSVQDGLQSQTLMTQQGNVRGTPSYMAPELFTGETRASVESDLYAVGLVYYECLTGEIAFNDKSFMRVAYKQVNEALEIPGSIPSCIADIISRLCEKKAEDRYHSAQNVIDDIDACIEKALKEEEKCSSEWEKNEKKRAKKKKKKNANAQQVTHQGIYSGKHKVRNIILTLLILALLAGGAYFGLDYANKRLQQALHPQNDNSNQDAASAIEDAALAIEKIKQQAAVDGASKSVFSSWNTANNKCSDAEKEEAEEVAKQLSEPPKTTPEPIKPSQNKQAGSSQKKKTNKKSGGSGRLEDASVELPF